MTAVIEGDEYVAIKSVHAVPSSGNGADPFLPIIKGEMVTVVSHVDNHRLLVENRYNIQGLVYRHHVHPADIYAREDFFLYDFTSKMAERILSGREFGTFLLRYNSRDSEKIVLSAKFDSIVHYSFTKKGGGIEYNDKTYLSIPSFINKCSNKKMHGLAGKLGKWLKQSDLNLPNITTGNVVTLQSIQMRIVGMFIYYYIYDFLGAKDYECYTEVTVVITYTIIFRLYLNVSDKYLSFVFAKCFSHCGQVILQAFILLSKAENSHQPKPIMPAGNSLNYSLFVNLEYSFVVPWEKSSVQ
jgi:hypothetical protein